jgi:hypothetical protein
MIRPAKIDRTSPEAAASVLNKLLPNQQLQRLILKELATIHQRSARREREDPVGADTEGKLCSVEYWPY